MKKERSGFGAVLILIGIIWLLYSMDVLSFNIIHAVIKLWPLFLIAAGFGLVFPKKRPVRTLVWVIVLLAVLGYGYFENSGGFLAINIPQSNSNAIIGESSIPLEPGIEKAELTLKLGGVNIDLDSSSGSLAELDSSITNLKYRYVEGSTSKLEYYMKGQTSKQQFTGSQFNLKISDEVPWKINANIGLIKGKMDFSSLDVQDISLKMGVGDFDVVLGSVADECRVDIDAGVGNLNITIPSDAGFSIRLDGALKNLDIDGLDYIQQGDTYYSKNYNDYDKKIEMKINMGISKINISTYKGG